MPALEAHDALWVMGGPMDVWEEAEHPWLAPEKAAIREAVRDREMPFLGICLGHQLLAEALGGTVGPMADPEVGFMEVVLTAAGRRDPLFRGFAPVSTCLQWHSAKIKTPPPGAEVLASSSRCPVQAFRAGSRAWGIQYHVEITADTVPEWGCVPVYAQSLERTMGRDALARLGAAAEGLLPDLNRTARRLYENFMELL